MKRFFICIFILGIFAAFVFVLGWTQIRISPDSVGIVVSKTGGVNEQPVIPGLFSWHKEFLLPTNAELKKFKINPVNISKSISGELPSGNLYTSIFNSSDNFKYDFTYSIGITLNAEELIDLVKSGKVSKQEDLDLYLEKCGEAIAQLTTDYILKKAKENPDFRAESIRREDLTKVIQFYKECPHVEISVFAITHSVLPDYSLYKKLQEEVISLNPTNQPVIQATNE